MVIDHVAMLVLDAADAAEDLRRRYGLGSEPGPYLPFAGTRGHSVPLEPPAYLEFHTIEDRDAAEATETGRRVLAVEAAGGGLFSWCVRVDDLEAVSKRLDIEIFDYTIPHGDGTLRGWRRSAAQRISRSSSITQTTATGSQDGGRRMTGSRIRPRRAGSRS